MRYFVHIYHVVRSKVLVEAEGHQEAMQAADSVIPSINHRVGYQMLSSVEEEQKMAPMFDVSQLPLHLQTESAEEVTGYLIDELGDDEYERTTSYNACGEYVEGNPKPNIMVVSDAERDTILAALRFWQRLGTMCDPEYDIALNGHGVDDGYALDDETIDALCERINS